MRMRALKMLPYGGRVVAPGEEFDVMRPIEALALSYQRKAQILEGLRLHLETATVAAHPSSSDSDSPADPPVRRRRRYRRRDLTAEP